MPMRRAAYELSKAIELLRYIEGRRGEESMVRRARERLEKVAALLSRCEKDMQRLDWLETSEAKIGLYNYLPVYTDGWTVRRAIDAGMSAGEAHGGGRQDD